MQAPRIAATIVLALGAIPLCAAFILWRSRTEMIRTWRPVEVQVIRSWMETQEAGAGGEESTSYSAYYELAYTIDGKAMRATARTEDAFLSGPQPVQLSLSRHSAGTRGVAYVSPTDPAKVRLDLDKNINIIALPLWLLVAGVSQFLIGLSLWLMGTPTVFW